MNINKITEIVKNPLLPHEAKEVLIIQVLAQDKNVIPTMMKILKEEREQNHELLMDMNLELSRADVHIENPMLGCGEVTMKATAKNKEKIEEIKRSQAREFVLNHITAFYVKYKGRITHCFNKQV